MPLLARHDHQSGQAAGPALRAGSRRARRPTSSWSISASPGWSTARCSRRAPRTRPSTRAGCRAACSPPWLPATPSTNTLPASARDATSSSSTCRWAYLFSAYAPLALLVGYLLGSIPFGLLLTQRRGPRRRAQDRLRQHRRHQRAAHRPQGARRRHAAARHAEGHGCRAARLRGRQALRRLRGLPARPTSPASAPSSATSSRSGSASRAARASPPTSACCSACIGRRPSCSAWCGSASPLVWRYSSLAALAATVAVVLYYLLLGQAGLLFILIMAHSHLRQAPCQHPPPACRRGEQDWRPLVRPVGSPSRQVLRPARG